MSTVGIPASAQSSTPTYGGTNTGAWSEVFGLLHNQTSEIGRLSREVEALKNVSSQVDVICKAYRDLHSYRILFLCSVTVLFVLSSFAVLYSFRSTFGELDWLLKLIAGSTGVGLLIECIYFPNKMRNFDKSLQEVHHSLDDKAQQIEALKVRISTAEAAALASSAKKRK